MLNDMPKLLGRVFCRRIFISFGIFVLIAVLFVSGFHDLYFKHGIEISFSLKYENRKNNHWQIFYRKNKKKDMNYLRSVPVVEKSKRYSTVIPCDILDEFRFNFGSHPGEVVLENVQLRGAKTISLRDMDIVYSKQLKQLNIKANRLTGYSAGNDPYVVFRLKKTLYKPPFFDYRFFWRIVVLSLFFACSITGILFYYVQDFDPLCNFVKRYWFVELCIMVLLIKYILIQGVPLVSIPWAAHDHAMMVDIADNIMNGEWLGNSYFNRYLAKGCAYPILVAIQNFLGLSLRQMAWLLYSSGCLLMTSALRSIVKSRLFLILIFSFLIFFPNLEDSLIYPYRSWSQIWQLLFIYSSLIAIFLHWKDFNAIFYWSIPGILGSVFYWFSFENAFWIAVLYPVSATIIAVFSLWNREKCSKCISKFLLILIPLFFVFLSHLVISSINYGKYGFFGTNIFTDGNFSKMMQAIYSVKPLSNQYNVPVAVPQEVFHRIYEVSPAINQYRNQLENSFQWWGKLGRFCDDNEVETGWLYWSIIACFEGLNFKDQDRIFRHTAKEIEVAIKLGKLKRRPIMLGTLVPPWREDFLPAMIQVTPIFLRDCKNLPALNRLSNIRNQLNRTSRVKNLPGIIKFSKVYRDTFWIDKKTTPIRGNLLNADIALAKLWMWWNPFLFYMTVFCLSGLLILAFWCRKKEVIYLTFLPLAVCGGIASLLFGMIYTHVSSFPALGYLGPVRQLFQLLFIVTISVFLFSLLSKDAFDLLGRMKSFEWRQFYQSSFFYGILFILISASACVWGMSCYLDIKKPYLMKDRSPRMKINEIEIYSLTDKQWLNGSHRNGNTLLFPNTKSTRQQFKGKHFFSLIGNDQEIFRISKISEKGNFLWLHYSGKRISFADGKKHSIFTGYAQ